MRESDGRSIRGKLVVAAIELDGVHNPLRQRTAHQQSFINVHYSPLPLAEMPLQSSFALLCLCASHVGTLDRWHNFRHFLASVSSQDIQDFKLFLGISFENPDLRKRFDEHMKANGKSTIHVFLFSKGQAQFERYNAILKALRDKRHVAPNQEPNTYLSFTDDDDLWAPERMRLFQKGAEKLHTDKRNPKYMFTIRHFKYDIESRKDVTRWDQLPIDEESFENLTHPREYCDIVCKYSLFVQFFKIALPELFSHPFCDMVLRNWIILTATLKDDRDILTYLRMNCSRPLYFYRQRNRAIDYSRESQFLPKISEVTERHKWVAKWASGVLLDVRLRKL